MGNKDPKWTREQRENVAKWRLDDDLPPREISVRFEQTYGELMPMNTINSLITDERKRRAENKPRTERIQAVLDNCLTMLESAAQAEKDGQPHTIDVDYVTRIVKGVVEVDKGTRNQPASTPEKPASPLAALDTPTNRTTAVSGSLPGSRAA